MSDQACTYCKHSKPINVGFDLHCELNKKRVGPFEWGCSEFEDKSLKIPDFLRRENKEK